MKLLTKAILRKLPPLYSTESKPKDEIPVIVKYFHPAGRMTFYVTEYDPETRTFFGFMRSPAGKEYDELGYSSLDDFEKFRGSFGIRIERDLHFGNHTLKEVMENYV